MKDRIFTGRDVNEAVAEAGRALGVDGPNLRYVVLEAGSLGALGIGGTTARIAVLLDDSEPTPPPSRPAPRDPDQQPAAPVDPRSAMRTALRSLAEVAGIDVSMEIEETRDAVIVHLGGPDREFFFEEDGDVLRSLEHLLQRIASRGLESRRLVVECEGYRERRDAALSALARELAAEVRQDGRSRLTDPLNSYERRIVHVALTDEPGVRTFSVGEGLDRRVTIAPANAPADDDEGNRRA